MIVSVLNGYPLLRDDPGGTIKGQVSGESLTPDRLLPGA